MKNDQLEPKPPLPTRRVQGSKPILSPYRRVLEQRTDGGIWNEVSHLKQVRRKP